MRSTQYPSRRRQKGVEPSPVESSRVSLEDVDELLDEIDSLLEDQAVLTNFRQRSGQ